MTLPLWLLTGLGAVRKALQRLFGLVATHPWQAACIALLAASAWLWHGWNGADAKLANCEAGRAADRKAYKDAQAAALAKALAAKAATEKRYSDLANKVDSDAKQAHDSAMADAERYIASHRVRSQAAGGSAGATPAAADDHGPQGGNGPGAAPVVDADLVTVTPDDVRICTANTTRLEATRQWALGLTR